MDINGNLKTPCNIYGICGCKQSGKNTVAKIWQLLDEWYNYPVEALVQDTLMYWRVLLKELKEVKTDVEYVLFELQELQFSNYRKSKWQEKSFSHPLKQILCILYGFRIEQFEDEQFKSTELPEQFWYWYMKLDGGYGDVIIPYTTPKSPKGYEGLKLIKPTPRMLLQKIGTDLFRNQLHPNWAINTLFSDYHPKVVINSAYGNDYQETPFDKNKKEHIDLWKAQQLIGLDNLKDNLPSWLITDIRFQNEADAVTERGGKLIKVIRYKVGDKVWFNDESEPDKDKNQSGKYTIIKINNNEEYIISNGTTELGAWNCEIKHINTDTHASEVEQDSIPVHYTIHNSTTLEDLIKSVKYIMIDEGVIKV